LEQEDAMAPGKFGGTANARRIRCQKSLDERIFPAEAG
jgi:hypothetical protein